MINKTYECARYPVLAIHKHNTMPTQSTISPCGDAIPSSPSALARAMTFNIGSTAKARGQIPMKNVYIFAWSYVRSSVGITNSCSEAANAPEMESVYPI